MRSAVWLGADEVAVPFAWTVRAAGADALTYACPGTPAARGDGPCPLMQLSACSLFPAGTVRVRRGDRSESHLRPHRSPTANRPVHPLDPCDPRTLRRLSPSRS